MRMLHRPFREVSAIERRLLFDEFRMTILMLYPTDTASGVLRAVFPPDRFKLNHLDHQAFAKWLKRHGVKLHDKKTLSFFGVRNKRLNQKS